jgi:hypothetical protein
VQSFKEFAAIKFAAIFYEDAPNYYGKNLCLTFALKKTVLLLIV